MKNEKQDVLTFVLFIVYMLLLIGVILFKLPFRPAGIGYEMRTINLMPFQGSLRTEISLNVLIFAPLGIYLCMLKNEWTLVKKALFTIGLSFSFEAFQFIFAIGRADITDIISNTLGGIIGLGIYAVLFKIFKNRTARIINMLALAVTICVVLRFGHLFYLSHFVMGRGGQLG